MNCNLIAKTIFPIASKDATVLLQDIEPQVEDSAPQLRLHQPFPAVFAMNPTPRLESVAPVFSTANLDRWLDHYRALGFEVKNYGQIYGYASRDGVTIHVSVNANHDPALTAGCAYVYVDDADALHALWSVVPGGRGPAPTDTPYGLREGGHLDPDGNLIRYGSRLEKKRTEELEFGRDTYPPCPVISHGTSGALSGLRQFPTVDSNGSTVTNR